jgi:hypothetical protein
VISRQGAVSIVEGFLKPNPQTINCQRLVVARVDERHDSWVVYVDTERYLKTQSPWDMLVPNSPFVVLKVSGAARQASSLPWGGGIEEAEAALVAEHQSWVLSNNRWRGP